MTDRLLADRIRDFIAEHKLTRDRMAEIVSTSRGTLNGWLDKNISPPACMIALMDLLEELDEARVSRGVHPAKPKPRGRPFQKGNPYRLKAAE